MEDKITPMDQSGGVGRNVEKIIVTFFSLDWKKLWLVSHKSWKNRVLKVLREMRKRTFLDMLPFVAYLRNVFRRSVILTYIHDFWRYMVLLFSDFKRNIFGWKVSEHGPSVLPTMDFWDLLKWMKISEFQTEYFWLKSVRTRTFGPSNHGLLG